MGQEAPLAGAAIPARRSPQPLRRLRYAAITLPGPPQATFGAPSRNWWSPGGRAFAPLLFV